VVCSYSVAIAGLAYKLEKAGGRCRPEPPLGSTPGCSRPYVQDLGEISQAIRRVCEASTYATTSEETSGSCPILSFAPENRPNSTVPHTVPGERERRIGQRNNLLVRL
jgi:hypothetical protein